jgi:hypothetical protein
MGYPANVGVIGVVAFEELAVLPPRPPVERPDALSRLAEHGKGGLYKSGAVGGTGTGFGKDVASGIYYVPFVRGPNKRAVTIYYDTPEALRRLGVPVDVGYPVPFPGDPGFCPPPPKWGV